MYAVDHGKASFDDLGETMKYVGMTAHSTHQQLSGILSATSVLSRAGEEGTEAGTGLRKVLDSFGAAGKGMGGGAQLSVMKQLGLTSKDFEDSKGHLKQLSDLMELVRSRMEAHHIDPTKNEAFQMMHEFFGTTGQETALNLLKSSDAVKSLNDQIERSDKMKGGGYVQWLAKNNMKTATNQINMFKQAWNAFGIASANTILPAVTGLVKGLDGFLLTINKMGPTAKAVVGWSALGVAAIAPISFAVGGLIKTFKMFGKAGHGFFDFFRSPISGRLESSQSKYTSETLGQNDKLVKSYQQVAKARADSMGETYTPSPATTPNNKGDIKPSESIENTTREDFKHNSRISGVQKWQKRFASRFHGKSATGTRFGKVGDAEHLFGDADALKDTANVAEHAGQSSRMLGLFDGAKAIGSKIPYLDVAIGATQLIGMNHKTIGKHLGSAAGMSAGTGAGAWAGGALGTLLDPFTFGLGTPIGTMAGGALGGWLGGKGGGKLGGFIQKEIPKHPFDALKNNWNHVMKSISKSSFGKTIGKSWESMSKEIGQSFREVGNGFHKAFGIVGKAVNPAIKSVQNFVKTLHTTKSGQAILKTFSIAAKASMVPLKLVFMGVGATFKVAMSLLKAAAKGAITFLTDSFTGMFKTIGGIFKMGADLLTGHWSNLGKDLGTIGSGIEKMMIAPFDAAWSAIKSIGSDIKNFVEGIWNSIAHLGSKIGNIARHPIKSIEHLFANGSTREYPNGLPEATRAVVNDGTGPELINFGNNFGMFKGRNVQTVLPKGSTVYNAQQTQMMVGVQHFANGTNPKFAKNVKISNNPIDTTGSQLELKRFRHKNIMSWKNIGKDTGKQTDQISKDTGKSYQNTSDNVTTIAGKMSDTLSKITSNMASDFNNVLQTLPKDAQASMQSVVNALNQGINGIDNSLSQFGGNGDVLKPFHYANGSDGKLPNDQIAMVNDATSGPIQEAVVRDGSVYLPKHRNQLMSLNKGDAVLNGTQTQKLINNYSTINHYANGSGVSDDKLADIAKSNAKNPNGFFNSSFVNQATPEGPALEKGLTGSIVNGIKSIGNKWSSAMWSLINNTITGDGGGSGSLGAFLKYAEHIGMGKKYVMGATGPDAYDCSGLVYEALKHFGITVGRSTVGEQASPNVHNLGKDISKAQVGDLAIFGHGGGAGGHVGIISNLAKGLMMNATPPSGRISSIQAAIPYVPGGLAGYYHVDGLNAGNSKQDKNEGLLNKLVKSELGSKALHWITSHLGETDMGGGAGGDSPAPTGDHKHWLEQAGISPSDYGAANYIISHESGWNPHTTNPNGGAYGLPQSLPASKMASAGADWHDNPITQLKWMKGYVTGRYGGFQQAQAYWETHHNYANGGWADSPSTFGEVPGQPEVAINPKRNSADRLIMEAINARQKVTGKPLTNLLKGRELSRRGHRMMDKLRSLLAKPSQPKSKPTVNITQNFTININGGQHDEQKLSKLIAQKVQEMSYNTFVKLHLNEG